MLIKQLLYIFKFKEMCNEIIAGKRRTFTEAYEIVNTPKVTHFLTDVVMEGHFMELVKKGAENAKKCFNKRCQKALTYKISVSR